MKSAFTPYSSPLYAAPAWSKLPTSQPEKRMVHPVLAIANLIGAFLVFIAGMVMQGQPEPDGGGILGNTYLFCVVLAGGMAGSAISLVVMPRVETIVQQFTRFAVGAGFSLVATPVIVLYATIPYIGRLPQTPEVLLASGAVVGMTGYGILCRALPAIINAWAKKVEDVSSTSTPPK